jgi:uroporphyrinogen III methyltransferase / synthase
MKKGTVYLVGAGPGDYRLITLKGLQCIQDADVIVHDRLADPRLLSYARADVELIYVGKESNRHTMRQEEINQVLVDKAKKGKSVLRLKGGDPYVFGRGGEEALFCLENDILFEEVPGITSAIAVPAYAGIPVTHRGIASSFSVITGHEDPAKTETSIRWESLATATDTLMFLMGMENLPYITKKLMQNGRKADTPVAVVRWGTKPEQEVLVGTLETIEQLVREQNFQPPAIIIVGEVVSLREQLRWFDNRPLFGKRIVVTRARAQASNLIELLEEYGADCMQYPTIAIEEMDDYGKLDQAIVEIETYQWIVFTSVNGVEHFYKRLYDAGKDSRVLNRAKIAAIGSQTAAALTEKGIQADFVPQEFRAEGLLAGFGKQLNGVRILIPRADEAREILPEELAKRGAYVNVVPAYRTVIDASEAKALEEALRTGRVDAITFTSSSTVKNFLSMLAGKNMEQLLKSVVIAAIGPITADTARDAGLNVQIIAQEYTIKGLTEALVKAIGNRG